MIFIECSSILEAISGPNFEMIFSYLQIAAGLRATERPRRVREAKRIVILISRFYYDNDL